MKKMIACLAAALLLLPACEKLNREENLNPEDFTEPVPIQLTRAEQTVRSASNDFGMKVFAGLLARSGDREVSFSPLSLSLALAMAGEGAKGDTFKQFADVIGWGDATKEEIGDYYEKMMAGLVKTDPLVVFSSSNSFWVDRGLSLHDSYRTLLQRYFSAESYTVDFQDPVTVDKINKWCSDKTEGKIPQMLDRLNPLTRLVLINALLFKAPWSVNWDVKKDRDFKGTDGKTKKDYLHTINVLSYGEYEN